jgi:hypothetical protein
LWFYAATHGCYGWVMATWGRYLLRHQGISDRRNAVSRAAKYRPYSAWTFLSKSSHKVVARLIITMLAEVYFLRDIPRSAILMSFPPSGNAENIWTNLLYVDNFFLSPGNT